MKNRFISAALTILIVGIAGCQTIPGTSIGPNDNEGSETSSAIAQIPFLIQTKSELAFDDTLGRVRAAIDAKGLKTFALIDHAAGATSIGEELRPTTLIIFGNPKAGTPLMKDAQSIGFDLPLKALVYEDADGTVWVATSDIKALASAHGLDETSDGVGKIANSLSEISASGRE